MKSLTGYVAKRNELLEAGDVEGIRTFIKAPNIEIAEIAMHKARSEAVSISREKRLASIEWLRERGYDGMGGLPLPPRGVLYE